MDDPWEEEPVLTPERAREIVPALRQEQLPAPMPADKPDVLETLSDDLPSQIIRLVYIRPMDELAKQEFRELAVRIGRSWAEMESLTERLPRSRQALRIARGLIAEAGDAIAWHSQESGLIKWVGTTVWGVWTAVSTAMLTSPFTTDIPTDYGPDGTVVVVVGGLAVLAQAVDGIRVTSGRLRATARDAAALQRFKDGVQGVADRLGSS